VDGVGAVDVTNLLLDTRRRPRRTAAPAEFAAPEPDEHGGPLDRLAAGVRGSLYVARHPGRLRDAFLQAKAMTDVLVRDEIVRPRVAAATCRSARTDASEP
jgi:hypothetical protein